MANYSKITDYAAKDLLLHLDPLKAIKGSEVGAEFDAIATMSATKTDAATLAAAGGAALVGNTPSGNIAATTVQAALNELDTEKAKVGANADITSMTALTAPTVAANPVRATDLQAQTNTRFTAAGTADAITGTLSPVPAALVTGLRVSTTPPGANTVTAPTLNVNALGAKKVFKKDSSGAAVALAAGDYNASGPFDFEYNTALDAAAGGWVLLNPIFTVGDASTTVKGKVQLATSAEAIAGTDALKAITPATLFGGLNASGSAPIYACRAWVNFNGTGVVAIRASGNVSSITDNGVGDYTVNFTNAMPDANYSVNGITTGASTINTSRNVCIKGSDSGATLKSTTQLTIQTANVNTTFVDVADISISIFR